MGVIVGVEAVRMLDVEIWHRQRAVMTWITVPLLSVHAWDRPKCRHCLSL